MKAQIKPRIDLKNRTKLETVIPLDVPFIIFIDPSDKCNFQCKFCPTGNRKLMKKSSNRNYGKMDFELYKKIIEDISDFEKPIKVLRLYKDGEPLLNPNFIDMIRYAKEKKCAERIDTTTNASLLNPEKNIEMINAGLDRINISIEGVNSKQYIDFSQYKINFEQFVENITHLYENRKNCEIIIKINGDILSEEDKQQFYSIFGDIADGVYIEHIMSCWPEFEFHDVKVNQELGIYGQKIQEVMVCPYPFYSFSINSDGTASLCFLDWARKLLIGDANTQSVKNIWLGEKMKEYQKMFLRHERKNHPVCKNCGQLTHGLPDDIDKYSDLLLKRIK
ncbi:MAG: radical SAM protein [Spirochaetota bacterium]|nr:radical SAM protein [Spirochaetota bacterium]